MRIQFCYIAGLLLSYGLGKRLVFRKVEGTGNVVRDVVCLAHRDGFSLPPVREVLTLVSVTSEVNDLEF